MPGDPPNPSRPPSRGRGGRGRRSLRRAAEVARPPAGGPLPPLEVSLVTAFLLPRSLIILLKGTILPFRLECLTLSGVLEKDIMPP